MQTKSWSLIEVVSSTTFGLVVSFIANSLVLPAFGFPVSWRDSFWIAIVFTVISVVRSYVFRRLFNWISG
jgi:hypothetical protein